MDIIIADDETIVQAAFRFVLGRKLDDAQIRCVDRGTALQRTIRERCPEVVILDWELHRKNPEALIDAVRRDCPHASIIVTSARPTAEPHAVRAGADRVVNKGEPIDGLIMYLRQLAVKKKPILN